MFSGICLKCIVYNALFKIVCKLQLLKMHPGTLMLCVRTPVLVTL